MDVWATAVVQILAWGSSGCGPERGTRGSSPPLSRVATEVCGTTGDYGQTQSDPRDRNRNGKLDWHEKGWFGNNDCKKATTIRDAGATVALGSAAGGFGPGIVVGGMIGVWGQFMVWSAC